MEKVISKDGASIAYEKRGSGSPLVLIHGAAADHTRWNPVISQFAARFTVYAVDRRGRGQSGDAEPYSIVREYEDVAAVVDSIDGPVDLLAHSYGALCSLEAALLTRNLGKLILYEPPVRTSIPQRHSPDTVDRMKVCLDSGKGEEALLIFLREIVEIPEEKIALLKGLPNWDSRVATAHTIPREEMSVKAYELGRGRFSRMTTDTLLLFGGDSPPFFKSAIHALEEALPNRKTCVMPGQQHAAMETGTDLFLREVIRFLTGE